MKSSGNDDTDRRATRIVTVAFLLVCCLLLSSCSLIDVRSQPSGAKVLINGKDTGKITPAQFRVRDLRSGTYTFAVTKEGYTTITPPQSVRVHISAGKVIFGLFPPFFPKCVIADKWKSSSDPKEFKLAEAPILDATAPAFQRPGTSSDTSLAQRWAVVIGVSKYKYAGQGGLNNLPYASDDAAMIAQWLDRAGWAEGHIRILLDDQATARDIRIALDSWLTKARFPDTILLFWAGHGFPDPEDPEKVYFACHDTDVRIPATGFRMDQVVRILQERQVKNVVLLADTCHAGKLITRGERGLSVIPSVKRMQEQNTVPKGWVFMVSADTDRKAIEHSSWRNGAFTHCLLQGLGGKADGFQSAGAKDGVVTMGELKSYMNTAMPDETQRVLGVAKHPVITTSTGDPDIWNLTLAPNR